VVTIVLMRLVLRTRNWKQTTGPEQMIGARAEVTEAIESAVPPAAGADAPGQSSEAPADVQVAQGAGQGSHESRFAGMVRLHGELWRAVATQPIAVGAKVRVLRVTGLTVHVTPVEQAARRNQEDAA
jgi:membrane-bound ClpP family serine protease